MVARHALFCGIMKVFEKRLSASERSRHWILVPRAEREKLPLCNEPFQIKVDSNTVIATIDRFNRIMGLGYGVFWVLHLDHPGVYVVLEKTPHEEYILKKK